jgi:protein SCO1/2
MLIQMDKVMTRIFAISSVVGLGVMVAGAVVAIVLGQPRGDGDIFAQCRNSVVAGGAGAIGGPFSLVNTSGQTVTDQDVITEPSLVYFGYTFCPDVCPLDTVRNAEAVDILQAQGQSATPVFITVDPNRDTPDIVNAFVDNIHPRMIGLTGTPDQTAAAADAYRVYYRSHNDGSDPYYLVDHSAFTYLVLPDYGFVEFFNRDVSPVDMAQQVGCFIDAAS